jgi:hypothetical protein
VGIECNTKQKIVQLLYISLHFQESIWVTDDVALVDMKGLLIVREVPPFLFPLFFLPLSRLSEDPISNAVHHQ